MPKYMVQATYTAEGLKGLAKDKASGRKAAVTKMLAQAGIKVESFYWTFGADDAVVICDAPDNTTAAAVSLAVSASGFVRLRTTPLLTVEEVDQALAKSVDYKVPGR